MKRIFSALRFSAAFPLPAILLCLALAAGCASRAPDREKEFVLTVLHTNDIHSAYGGLTAENRVCYQAQCEDGKGGSVRLDRALRAVRRDRPGALFLGAGDEFQGTLFWTMYKEKPASDIIDILRYTAVIPGNHEFDEGNRPFLNLVKALKTPVIAANLSFSPPLGGAEGIRPWIVTRQGGHSIGIVGVANEQTPVLSSPGPEARFAGEVASLKKAVADLTAQGADIIIAVTHIGYENDKRLARQVPGLDIIVGGHSHSLLSNMQPRAEGPYPTVEKSPEGNPVLVVSASTACVLLGRLDVVFDAAGVPLSWNGEPISLDEVTLLTMKAPSADRKLSALIENYAKPVRAKMREPLGSIQADRKDGSPLEEPNVLQCRAEECLTGDIVADALLRIPFKDAQMVLLNGGALRNSLPAGVVTTGDVLGTLPFQNTPIMADMPGAVLLRALEHAVSTYGQGEGRFLQTAGLRYAFDPRKPVGQRIVRAEFRDANEKWLPVRKQQSYRVATVDYLGKGGDGFAMFKPLKWREAEMLMNDALRIYLEQNSPLRVHFEDRIRRVK